MTPSRADWLALHVFYSAESRPLLTECVAPLVQDLREQGLIENYFFINYWLEGPHVRLRLKPATLAATADVRATAEAAITAFLARRPALYEADFDALAEFYDQMFDVEFTPEERLRMYPDGRMPVQGNNTIVYRPYEPEYGKYGGPRGVELAEWHFEHSSDLVLELIRTMNVHLRPVMLGLSAQIMMIMTSTFLADPSTMRNYLDRYHHHWSSAFDLSTEDTMTRYRENYDAMGAGLATRFTEIHTAVQDGSTDRLTSFRSRWAAHCRELRARVLDLGRAGELVFPPRSGVGAPKPITEPDVVLPYLLTPYLHMTNNRLGATLIDEAYLAYLLSRTLEDAEADLVSHTPSLPQPSLSQTPSLAP